MELRYRRLPSTDVDFDLVDTHRYEPEDLPKETLVLLVASMWQDDTAPVASLVFATWLADAAADFRGSSLLLSRCRFAVFGVISLAYGHFFNVAKGLAEHLRVLGATKAVPLCEGDWGLIGNSHDDGASRLCYEGEEDWEEEGWRQYDIGGGTAAAAEELHGWGGGRGSGKGRDRGGRRGERHGGREDDEVERRVFKKNQFLAGFSRQKI